MSRVGQVLRRVWWGMWERAIQREYKLELFARESLKQELAQSDARLATLHARLVDLRGKVSQ